eukprot:m.211512 g.211512  ORF g.211512 m.211512 type:complete len:456 (+) comp18430_c0_seq1:49-1416(+)
MSFRSVRVSKYRHVFGNVHKKEEGFDDVRISRNAWDSNFCSVNPKFLAIVLEAQGGGAFAVLNLDSPGRIGLNSPKCAGHTAPVLDIQFCPYNDHVIASCAEDCMVMVWQIPEAGLKKDIEPKVTLIGHQRRVGIVEWHPTAENVLASAGFDYQIIIWDIGTGAQLKAIDCHTDTIYSMNFNWDGSLLATSSKDKMIRVIDPRKGTVLQQGKGHDGSKASRVNWCGETGKLFSTGFTNNTERQFALWDPNNLSAPIKSDVIDTASGVLFTFYDNDTQMLYVAGKGDGNIRYYELDTENAPYVHPLAEFKSSAPQRGVGWLPKRGMVVSDCEVARAYKLQPKGTVDIISFIVPRKSTLFQEDIFPPTRKDEALLSASAWMGGQNATPTKVSMKEGYVQPTVQLETSAPAAAAGSEEDKPPQGEKALLKAWHEMRDEIKRLKAQLSTAEIKIRTLTQ